PRRRRELPHGHVEPGPLGRRRGRRAAGGRSAAGASAGAAGPRYSGGKRLALVSARGGVGSGTERGGSGPVDRVLGLPAGGRADRRLRLVLGRVPARSTELEREPRRQLAALRPVSPGSGRETRRG